MNKAWRLLTLTAVGVWIVMGIYGALYNITYVDEAKYLIKGWLMATGRVGYYSTPEFFYQHMPGGLLWYGLGQKMLGPSLLVGRIQSWLLGLAILSVSYGLAKKLFGKKAGIISLVLLSLTPTLSLYYSSAVPLSISALMLMLGGLSLVKEKRLWASLWFSGLFIVRENFLFTLIIYLAWLSWYYRKEIVKHLLVVGVIVGAALGPGLPGILKIFKNFPGINLLGSIDKVEESVLRHWQQQMHSGNLYWQAIKGFAVAYLVWILVAILIWQVKKKVKINKKQLPVWRLLVGLFWFNLVAHAVAVFQLSPKAIVSYFAYVAPLGAVLASGYLDKLKNSKLLVLYWLALVILPGALVNSSIFTKPQKETTISKINRSAKNLSKYVESKEKIVWLAEPMSLYLAEKVSYYPLINHTNFFRPTDNTRAVSDLGFWNQEIMGQWLKEADLLVIDPNRLKLMGQTQTTRGFVSWFEEEVDSFWEEKQIQEYVWPEGLRFYERSLTTL